MSRASTFVLVHGANLGGWCWHEVQTILEENEYEVHSPSLDFSLNTSLRDHVDAVAELIVNRDLNSVVLVGHSYGGMVITGAADRIKDRLARLVYLDAAVPLDGDDFASHVPGLSLREAEERREFYRGLSFDGIWLSPPPLQLVGIHDDETVAEITPRLVSQPLATWLEPIRLSNGGAEGMAKTYVLAIRPQTEVMGYPRHAELARQSGDWTCRQIDSGHAMMLTAPRETAFLLLEAAQMQV